MGIPGDKDWTGGKIPSFDFRLYYNSFWTMGKPFENQDMYLLSHLTQIISAECDMGALA